jgi:septin 3/9/12
METKPICAFFLSWEPIIKYIKDQHSAYLRKELTARRERYIVDTRVHCCLFFITPSGHA